MINKFNIMASMAAVCVISLSSPAFAANNYWTHSAPWVDGQTITASSLNTPFEGVEDGFDKLPAPNAGAPTTKGFSEVFLIEEGTVRAHPLTVGQFQDIGGILFNTAVGTDTYTLDLSPNVPAYVTGARFCFKPQNDSTGAVTLNVDGLGAKAIKRSDGTDLLSGDLDADGIYCATYDGTDFAILGLPQTYDQALNTSDDVNFNQVQTDTIIEETGGAGVTIDGVLVKDGSIGLGYGGTGATDAAGALGNIFTGFPMYSADMSAGETIADSSWDKLDNWAEEFDLTADFDEVGNTDKWLPTEAGKYIVALTIAFDNSSGGTCSCKSAIYKNGVLYTETGGECKGTTAEPFNIGVSAIVDMNGTTDYIEFYAYQDSGGTLVQAETNTRSSSTWIAE